MLFHLFLYKLYQTVLRPDNFMIISIYQFFYIFMKILIPFLKIEIKREKLIYILYN